MPAEPWAAVVLAAGHSRRMGQPKLLLPWRGEPLVRYPVRAALAAGAAGVWVVVGAAREEVAACLQGFQAAGEPVHVVFNPRYAEGQAESLKVGLAALPPGIDVAVVLLGDQPRVSPALLRRLVAAAQAPGRLGAATLHTWEGHGEGREGRQGEGGETGGEPGVPAALRRALWQRVGELRGDEGARRLLRGLPEMARVPAGPGELADVDSPEDYRELVGGRPPEPGHGQRGARPGAPRGPHLRRCGSDRTRPR